MWSAPIFTQSLHSFAYVNNSRTNQRLGNVGWTIVEVQIPSTQLKNWAQELMLRI